MERSRYDRAAQSMKEAEAESGAFQGKAEVELKSAAKTRGPEARRSNFMTGRQTAEYL